MPIVIEKLDPKTGKRKKKMPLPKRKPRHANPNHPMNTERTTGDPRGVNRKASGGKLNALQKRKIANDKALASGFMNLTKEEREKEKARLARKKAGGKLKMVEKGGKKVPFYAADGKGKMAMGGMMKKKGYAKGGSVKVKSGDTLSQIAKSKGVTLKSLMAANPGIKNANEIRVGQSIKMPAAGTGRGGVYSGMTKSSMKALADDTTAKRAKKVVASSGGEKRIRRRKGADLPEQANKRARVTTRLNQLGEINKQRRAADADKKPQKAKRSRPAIPSNDIAAKKGGVMKAKGYKHGGKMCRGGGAATKGKRYGKAG